MTRYHPLLVALHWTLAILISISLLMGFFALDPIPESDPMKIDALRGHMIAGGLILILMVVRLITRLRSQKPPEVDSGNALLNLIARPIHLLGYFLIFAMLGTGIAMSAMAGLPAIVFGGSGDPLPASFDNLPTRAAHGFIGMAIVAFIVVHLCAVIFHESRGTALLRRMWFGKRS